MILEKGTRGSAVRWVQSSLAALGYNPGPINGVYDSRTENAVIRFQRAQNIEVDGIVGPETSNALAQALSKAAVKTKERRGGEFQVQDTAEKGGLSLKMMALIGLGLAMLAKHAK